MRRLLFGLTAALVMALLAAPPVTADTPVLPTVLPLGDPTLREIRQTVELAPGVLLTRIVRGTKRADPEDYQRTDKGPWRINVLEIDPSVAAGRLKATYGPALAPVEPVSTLTARSGALTGVNASYFAFTSSRRYPGNPVGLGVYGGELMSEPTGSPAEVSLLVDGRTNKLRMDHFTWRGRMVHRSTGATLRLAHLNDPIAVPGRCRKLKNPTRCRVSGSTTHLNPRFTRVTPSGKGVEVLLNARGCVVRRTLWRGRTLKPGQTSVQATGRQSKQLWQMGRSGCLDKETELFGSDGTRVELGPWISAVNGRYRLTSRGKITLPRRPGDQLFARHPRTFVGRKPGGVVALVTVDGRQPTSVGTTMRETARVALALGIRDAINLDGGGSTTMMAAGERVNRPSGGTERSVGDALVFVPAY